MSLLNGQILQVLSSVITFAAYWLISDEMIFEIHPRKNKNGGTELPPPETAATRVISGYLPGEVIAPTCLNPFLSTTFFGFCNVSIVVSSSSICRVDENYIV